MPHIFERFRQADQSTTRIYGGLGLGLAIVRYLAEQHGGSVTAESPGEGQGATFTIRLPIRSVPAVSQEPVDFEARAIRPWKDWPDLSGVRVLVIEDEPDACETIKLILEERGAVVACASSVKDARRYLLSQPAPDVLVADICMPEEDGFSMIRQIRTTSLEPIRKLPAIALTALATEDDKKRIFEAGFQSYLAKPVEPGDLVETVAKVAQRTDHGKLCEG